MVKLVISSHSNWWEGPGDYPGLEALLSTEAEAPWFRDRAAAQPSLDYYGRALTKVTP